MNAAQTLLYRMGVDAVTIQLGHHKMSSPSSTKKGPGRRHVDGYSRKQKNEADE